MSIRQNRSHRHRRSGNTFSEINVTPLVDVMLVLLIVFMVTAPMLTVGVPVDLPKTQAAKLADQVEPIVISVGPDGKSYLQEIELQGEALVARLMAITGSNPDARIYVRGDKSIAYGKIMEIMGDVAASGFTKVSLIAEMPAGGPKKGFLSKESRPSAIALNKQQQPILKKPSAQRPQQPSGQAFAHPPTAGLHVTNKGVKKGQ